LLILRYDAAAYAYAARKMRYGAYDMLTIDAEVALIDLPLLPLRCAPMMRGAATRRTAMPRLYCRCHDAAISPRVTPYADAATP